jgi:pyridoxal phosphate phosphatase PHOSPHO2
MQWTRAMRAVMERAAGPPYHATAADVHAALARVPIHPDMIAVVRSVVAGGGRCSILSDANRVFIDSILAHHGLTGLFDAVVTNPAWFCGERLVIEPYWQFDAPSGGHGCARPQCPLNMCKGRLLREALRLGWSDRHPQPASGAVGRAGAASPSRRVMYLGDGAGDLCACMQLGE